MSHMTNATNGPAIIRTSWVTGIKQNVNINIQSYFSLSTEQVKREEQVVQCAYIHVWLYCEKKSRLKYSYD